MAGILGMHALAAGGMPPASAGSSHSQHDGSSPDLDPDCLAFGQGGHASMHVGCDPAPPAPGLQLGSIDGQGGAAPAHAAASPVPRDRGRIPAAPTLEQLSVNRR
ncbi:DUF6153 family protein [Arthrobacter sp. HY1533]|uniref:DUF6153 family protein n=1 Tax=Arthrobacter sp. HY1533 TaxID=2970919 RepID=UPI003FA4BD4E